MTNQELTAAVLALKKEQDAVILAHTYQRPEVLAVADITGDSFMLSKAAQKLSQRKVLLCGVRFMAETVKILSPEKEVVLSHAEAGCPMAEQIDPKDVAAYREEHPDHAVCAYINTTAELKAVCDVCVTSSSAVEIVSKLPQKDVLFLPDKNLGSFVQKALPQKRVHLMNGCCYVHNAIRPEMIEACKKQHPDAKIAIHPECPADAVALCDMAGSTKEIIEYAKREEGPVVFATERGVYDELSLLFPSRTFYQLQPELMNCQDMKKTTLKGVYDALCGVAGEVISLDEDLRLKAKKSIDNMLRLGG